MKKLSARHLLVAIAILISVAVISAYQSGTALATDSTTRYTDGSFVKSVEIIFDKEYTVSKIDFEGTPGGELCGAAITATAYDANGKSAGIGTTSRGDAHKTKSKSVTFSTPIKVKRIIGKPTGDGNAFTTDCSYIDHLKATLYYTASGGSTGGSSGGSSSGGSTGGSSGGSSSGGSSTATNALSVNVIGGVGTITSSPEGINCGHDCSKAYAAGTSVTLTATGTSVGLNWTYSGGKYIATSSTMLSKFSSWSSDCTGTQATCTVKMDKARQITAKFSDAPYIEVLGVHQVSSTGDKYPYQENFEFRPLTDQGLSDVTLYVDGVKNTELTKQKIYSSGKWEDAINQEDFDKPDIVNPYYWIWQWEDQFSVGTHTYYITATDISGNVGRWPATGTGSFTVKKSP